MVTVRGPLDLNVTTRYASVGPASSFEISLLSGLLKATEYFRCYNLYSAA